MQFTAEQIAQLLNGEIEGDAQVLVNDFSKIEEGKPGALTFLSNPKYIQYIYETKASVVIVNKDFVADQPISATLIRVENAYSAIAQLLDFYEQSQPKKSGIEEPSFIHSTAKLGDFAYVGAFAYIGENVKIGDSVQIYPQAYIGDNVTIGDNTIIYSGVKIYKQCKIGAGCILHSGAVVGSDGFGFAPDANNEYKKIPQIGNVVIGDNVEIGANTTIDRATMGSTIIKKGTKLDNLVQIAHNVEIGSNTVIAANAGVAGSAKVGNWCQIGGQVGIAGHIELADQTKVAAQSGVAQTTTEVGATLFGSPAMDARHYKRVLVVFSKLPEMHQKLREIEKQLKALDKKQ